MRYKTREYPLFSACGLNCGLCPRYYTVGSSRCPGCAGECFLKVHPACGVLSCCQRKGLEHCFLCNEFPCKKYDGADLSDSFITHKNQFNDMEKAKRIGLKAYLAEMDKKIKALEALLQNYDDGRRKSFFCLAVNLLDLADCYRVLERLDEEIEPQTAVTEKSATAVRLFQAVADEKGVVLKLRK